MLVQIWRSLTEIGQFWGEFSGRHMNITQDMLPEVVARVIVEDIRGVCPTTGAGQSSSLAFRRRLHPPPWELSSRILWDLRLWGVFHKLPITLQ